MSMKCSRCGYRAADIGAMGRHYRKKHPKIMAAKKRANAVKRTKKHCPHCGRSL